MSADVAIALAGVGAGAVVQSATGFGFALIAAPLAAAGLGPVAAVPTVAVASVVVNAMTVAAEQRRPEVLGRAAVVLTLTGVPGMLIGAVILAEAPEDVLRIIVALIVIGSVIAVTRTPPLSSSPAVHDHGWGEELRTGTGIGFLAGALVTTSGVNGPALLVHLRRAGVTAGQMRDTLAAIFFATGVLTVASIAAVGALDLPGELLLIVAGAVVGQMLGRLAFAALARHREAATRFVLALSVAAAAVPAVQALA